MQTEHNTIASKQLVTAAEARERSINGKLAQLNASIADVIEAAVNSGRTEVEVQVSEYSEIVVTKATQALRDAGYKVKTNPFTFGKKTFAASLTVSWAE